MRSNANGGGAKTIQQPAHQTEYPTGARDAPTRTNFSKARLGSQIQWRVAMRWGESTSSPRMGCAWDVQHVAASALVVPSAQRVRTLPRMKNVTKAQYCFVSSVEKTAAFKLHDFRQTCCCCCHFLILLVPGLIWTLPRLGCSPAVPTLRTG